APVDRSDFPLSQHACCDGARDRLTTSLPDYRCRSISAGSASIIGDGSSRAALARCSKSETSASRLCTSSFLARRPFGDPTAYSQNKGNAIVESQYATTVSGSTPGFTLPQLTASAGVAPDSPPQTTWSVVIWMKKSLPPLGMP